MGQWENKLQELLTLFEDNQKQHEELEALWQKVINGAKAFITAHAKCNPLLAKGYSEMMNSQEEAGRAVAELSVYEDEYDAAKKSKDKDQMKQLDDKMKPLIKTFDASKKKHRSAADEIRKLRTEIMGALDGVRSACG